MLFVCLVPGYSVKNNSLEVFFTSTGNEPGHIEKAISLFIDETKSNTSLLARHPAVLAADASINSFIDQKSPKSSADHP